VWRVGPSTGSGCRTLRFFKGAGFAVSAIGQCTCPRTSVNSQQTNDLCFAVDNRYQYDILVELIGARVPSASRKSCASAARSLKLPQNPQSHPGYHFIKAALSERLQNQHFHNCSFHRALTPVSATLTKNQGRGAALQPQSFATRHSPLPQAHWARGDALCQTAHQYHSMGLTLPLFSYS
jgi:hypothetical protein